MSKKYIIKHIEGEMLNFLVNGNKPNVIGMEHDYCKTTECSTLVDHYDEYFKRISTVQFENKSDLISNKDTQDENTIYETTIGNDDNDSNYNDQQNIDVKNEIILYNNENPSENYNTINTNNSNNNDFIAVNNIKLDEIGQTELDSACQSIISDLPNDIDSIPKENNKKHIKINKSMIYTNDDPIANKNLKELSILLREENLTGNFIPNQTVHYETYQEAVANNNGKTTKKKCFKNCNYEEGRLRITKEEIQTYNKCKKHILLKDFLKLLIWKKFPTINNVCHFNISSVNIAPRTGYTIYAYCKFLNCNNFRIIVRQSSYSLIGIVYKSRLEPLHYKNVPLVEQIRGLKKKLLGTRKFVDRTNHNQSYDWNDPNTNGNVFARKDRNKKSSEEDCDEKQQNEDYDMKQQNEKDSDEQQQNDEDETMMQRTDEEILYSCEVIVP